MHVKKQPSFSRSALILLFVVGFAFFWSRVLSLGAFVDEQENVTAGWLVAQRQVPYRDFFFHHAPLPYFLSALGFVFGDAYFLAIRILVGLWCAICLVFTLRVCRKETHLPILVAWAFLLFVAPIFHFQMMLAESICLPVILSLFFMLYEHVVFRSSLSQKRIGWILGCSFVLIWTNITTFFILGWILAGFLLLNARRQAQELRWPKRIVATARSLIKIGRIPILVFGFANITLILYFLANQALPQTIWSVFTYNTQYYYPLRLAGNEDSARMGYVISLILKNLEFVITEVLVFLSMSVRALRTLFTLFIKLPTQFNEMPQLLFVTWREWINSAVQIQTVGAVLFFCILAWVFKSKGVAPGLWILLGGLFLRTRDNERFKLGLWYVTVFTGAILVLHLLRKRKQRFWFSLLVTLLISYGFAMADVRARSVIPSESLIYQGDLLRAQEIEKKIPKDAKKVLVLNGNPFYYVLLKKVPAHRQMYYYPWFHQVPSMRSDLQAFLSSNAEYPVIIPMETIPGVMDYAEDMIQDIRNTYETSDAPVYRPKK